MCWMKLTQLVAFTATFNAFCKNIVFKEIFHTSSFTGGIMVSNNVPQQGYRACSAENWVQSKGPEVNNTVKCPNKIYISNKQTMAREMLRTLGSSQGRELTNRNWRSEELRPNPCAQVDTNPSILQEETTLQHYVMEDQLILFVKCPFKKGGHPISWWPISWPCLAPFLGTATPKIMVLAYTRMCSSGYFVISLYLA